MTTEWPAGRILDVLPHRHEMLLCPPALVDPEAATGEGVLRVPRRSWMDRLGVPHLVLVEALGQLAGLVLASSRPPDAEGPARGYLAEIPEARFAGRPAAEAEIRLSVAREIAFGALHRFRVRAETSEEVLVEGTITIATAP